ncbi:MAG: MBL fold metallo-hydrolase [Bacteroidia bacterium]|jgi:metallo-beta-lactamase family protein
MQIAFHGAAQVVTGSKHLITTPRGVNILLDCGLFQGRMDHRDELNRHFGFNPTDVDYVVLSHAHIDHCGLLPRLVREGFRGIIFATPATIDLCNLMLFDSAHIQTDDLKYVNQRRAKKGKPLLEPLYDVDDVERALDLFVPVEYDEELHIDAETTLLFTDAGHLIGSAAVHLDIKKPGDKKLHITFTGDIGRKEDPILRSPQKFRQCDILICESTYGDRLHPVREDSEQMLYDIVLETCVKNLGKLIIPAFSVDRTQEIVYALEKMFNNGKLPNIKIYVDSPLSVRATHLIREHEECYNENFLAYMHQNDPEPFSFRSLTYITDVMESKALNDSKQPCIIISASGMAEAGRVKHHIANNIANPNNTILLVGYCTPESLGGRLKAGEKVVRIFGEEHAVKARVESLESYSSHADYHEIEEYLNCIKPSKVKTVFLVHGEQPAQEALKTRLIHQGYKNVLIPAQGEIIKI